MSPGDIQVLLLRLDQQDDRLERIEARQVEQNGRVKRLEQAKAYADGLRAAHSWIQPLLVALVAGVVVALVAAFVGAA